MTSLDAVWFACAREIGVTVRRGGDAYVHFDGEELHLAEDEHLDADDTAAQLILHELCHLAVQGPAHRYSADWGLDNTTDEDADRERAAVRVQAHVTGAFALRDVLFPTTVVRAFFEGLPADALRGDATQDPSIALARDAVTRIASGKLGRAVHAALAQTMQLRDRILHRASGAPIVRDGDARTCGDCAWRSASGTCMHARDDTPVRAAEVAIKENACVRHERADDLECLSCGACCRSAYDAVLVDPIADREFVARHPGLTVLDGESLLLKRNGDRCAALSGPAGGPFVCGAYDARPSTCRDFERGSTHCLTARSRVGLSII